MNDRLKQFLTMENISPARFAEELGIQRSGISHLLSGRNKPSFEFLQRMMNAYPEVNYEWLILGKGRPYKNDHSGAEIESRSQFFTEPEEVDTLGEEGLFAENQSFDTDFEPEQPAENRVFTPEPAPAPVPSGKKIARIIVFFNDGTYEEK